MVKKTLIQHILERTDPEAVSVGDALPNDVFEKISKLIQDAAMEEKYNWTNALELVHQAYKVCKVQRPAPYQPEAWHQYEQHIEAAVRALQKATEKGIRDDSWKFTNLSNR